MVDAVQCGVAVQKEIETRNPKLPESRRMQFRHQLQPGGCDRGGADSIYGDGVNIAARLESLADPGGICVSKTAFEHIEAKLPFGYEFSGRTDRQKYCQTGRHLHGPDGAKGNGKG